MAGDRNDRYLPDGMYLNGPQNLAEIGPPRPGHVPQSGRIALGYADELNRVDHWWWADVSGDGTHWSHFNGHRVQVDIELHTENRREVNHWKGRDEIRSEGTWTLALNRQPCWEGRIGADPLEALLDIRRIAGQLINHDAIDWTSPKPVAEQLLGRRVYYDRTPAVISSTSVLDQGCVMLTPVGADLFPPAVYTLDRGEDDDPYERDRIKVDLLDPKVWWWRDRSYGEEPKPAPVDPESHAVDPCKPMPSSKPEADRG